jgi:5,10-methylenetetrahydromethanopterin reductase
MIPISLLLNAEYEPSELIQVGRLAEDLGYSHLWYTDIRLFRECFIGLAALAANTSRISLGPGVTDPYSRHPAVTAATMATLDELAHGRALLGLGVGGTSFKELGITISKPLTALRESVDVIRRLWRGEEVTVQGKIVSLRSGRLQFAPVRDRIPIYFATHGAQVTRLAGEIADGVLIANTMVPRAVDFYVAQAQEGAAKAGRSFDEVDISIRPEVCIAENEDAAIEVIRRRVALRLLWTYPHWEYLERLNVDLPPELEAIAKGSRSVDEALRYVPKEALYGMGVAGDAEHVAAQLAAAIRPGVTSVTVRAYALPGGGIAPMVRSFIEDVMPMVERALGGSLARGSSEATAR